MTEAVWIELGAVVVAAVLASIGWLGIRVLRSIERRLDAIEEGQNELRRQAANHDQTTTRVVAIVEGLESDHQRLDQSVTRIEERLINHLIDGKDE